MAGTESPTRSSKVFRLLPSLLLMAMLAIAVVLELTVLDPAARLVELWLPKLPLAVLLALPWLPQTWRPRRHRRNSDPVDRD